MLQVVLVSPYWFGNLAWTAPGTSPDSKDDSMLRIAKPCAALSGISFLALVAGIFAPITFAQSEQGAKDQPLCGTVQSQVDFKSPPGTLENSVRFVPFAYVSRNIYLQVFVEGPNGKGAEEEFILDTGTNRTTLDRELAILLNLPQVGTTRATWPAGTSAEAVVELGTLRLAGHECKNLQIAVTDLGIFSRGYQRKVSGLIGMDFLKSFILLIDYPRRRLAFLRRPKQMKEFREVGMIPLQFKKGLLLAKVDLPNGSESYLIVDTGSDFPEDVLLYRDIASDLEMSGLTSTRILTDATGSAEILSGQISWIDFGNLRLEPANVAVHPQSQPNLFDTPYRPGLMGNGLFEKFVLEIDGPQLVLRFLEGPPVLRRRSTLMKPAKRISSPD